MRAESHRGWALILQKRARGAGPALGDALLSRWTTDALDDFVAEGRRLARGAGTRAEQNDLRPQPQSMSTFLKRVKESTGHFPFQSSSSEFLYESLLVSERRGMSL